MYKKMDGSVIDWLGDTPDGWQILRNKNCFVCSKNIVGEKSAQTQLLSLTTQGIKKKRPEDSTGKVPETYDTYQIVEPNDIVMCLFDLDVSAVFSGISPFKGMISPAYKVLKCKSEIITPLFADYWFSFVFDGRKFKHYAKNLRYTLNYDEFAALPIVIPRIEEQQRIVNLLDCECARISEVIEQTRASIEEYKKLKQSIISESVTKGIRKKRKLKDSGIEWIGDIPEEWRFTKTLNCLSMPITDGPHTTPELFDEGICFISAESVSCGNGRIDFSHKRGFISQDFYEECCKKYIPEIDDIYMIKSGATTGRVSMVDTLEPTFTIWSPLAVFRCDKAVMLPRFMFYALQSEGFQKQVELGWTYGTQQNIGMRTLEQLKVCVPCIEEQSEITRYVDSKCTEIDKVVEAKQQLILAMEAYKKAVVYEFVTGKKEA